MDTFLRNLNDEFSSIVIFGYSAFGKWLYENLREKYKGIILFCDNSKDKQVKFKDTCVLSVEDAVRKYPEAAYIITALYYGKDMVQQLKILNIKTENIFNDLPEYLQEKRKEIKQFDQRKELKDFHIDVDITRHCNLNCKSCGHFSPLAREEHYDLKQFESDIKRLKKLFGKKMSYIQLLGGEPLLNPNVSLYMNIARQSFPETEIIIITNGILVLDMKEEFWKSMHDYDIVLAVTHYPIKLDYEAIKEKAATHNVKMKFFGQYGADGKRNNFWLYPLDLEGKQDYKKSFNDCLLANQCISLKNGKLYTCGTIACIDAFNDYFGVNIPVTDEDGIDIYKAESADEITSFLNKPVPFCAYCNVNNRVEQKWEISRKRITEWKLKD